MKVNSKLYFENDHVFTSDPPDQAWFSNHDDDIQFYLPHGLWVAMGRPQALDIEYTGAER